MRNTQQLRELIEDKLLDLLLRLNADDWSKWVTLRNQLCSDMIYDSEKESVKVTYE